MPVGELFGFYGPVGFGSIKFLLGLSCHESWPIPFQEVMRHFRFAQPDRQSGKLRSDAEWQPTDVRLVMLATDADREANGQPPSSFLVVQQAAEAESTKVGRGCRQPPWSTL